MCSVFLFFSVLTANVICDHMKGPHKDCYHVYAQIISVGHQHVNSVDKKCDKKCAMS